jgi:hypothetical protein
MGGLFLHYNIRVAGNNKEQEKKEMGFNTEFQLLEDDVCTARIQLLPGLSFLDADPGSKYAELVEEIQFWFATNGDVDEDGNRVTHEDRVELASQYLEEFFKDKAGLGLGATMIRDGQAFDWT